MRLLKRTVLLVAVSISLLATSNEVYTITYDPGKYGVGAIKTVEKLKDETITIEGALFTTEGHRQTGWRSSETSHITHPFGSSYSLNESLTLYPYWSANTYTVHFDANGGGGTMADMAMQYAVPTNLSLNAFSKGGCVFEGWATNRNGNVVYADGARVKNLTSDHAVVVTLYARWRPNADVPTVTNTTARQRYPWNGLVDITCKVTGIDGETNGLKFAVAAVMPDTGKARNVSHFWVVQGGTNSTDREVHTNGNYRLLWDARADLGIVRYTNMVVRVNLDAHEKVQLWEDGPYWATTNIGAEKPEEYGYYFWWGDTVGYKRENNAWVATDGSSSNFQFYNDPISQQTSDKSFATLQSEGWIVSQDGTYILAPEHDAAQVQWGGGWRMPTDAEFSALISNCTITWSTINGVYGRLVTGKGAYADRSIFLPPAGIGDGSDLDVAGSGGYYWSSTPISDGSVFACRLYFISGDFGRSSLRRCFGQSVRPVQEFTMAHGATLIRTDDSAPFLLDTVDGTRIAREVETITYSPHWNGAASCSVAVDGKQLLSTAEEGITTWPCPASPGTYTLTHTAGDETLTAQFKVPVTLNVANVSFRQRYPWNGLVDIDCTVNCNDPATNISLYVSAKDTAANKSLAVRSVWLENDATHTNALVVKSGSHRLVWDAGMDNPNFVGDAVTVEVQAHLGTELYLVIDLSGGKDAVSYPISNLGAEPQGGWTDEYKTTKLVLRRIQPGTVPTRDITITQPFYIGVFEVTQRQYELVTGNTPSYFNNAAFYATRPVEQVSYNMIRGSSNGAEWPASSAVDATSFIGILRSKTGIENFDLPTEAQWEYACRAETTTHYNNGKNYTNSSQDSAMDEVGRYWYNGGSGYSSSCETAYGTAPVGSYLPNNWGLYDMHGNVLEWCLDWYDSSFSGTDPVGSSAGSYRVLRGGSWNVSADYCTSSYRDFSHPSAINYYGVANGSLGFRLARTLPKQLPTPNGLVASVSRKSISLSWNAVSEVGTYEVWRSTTDDLANAVCIASPQVTSYSDSDATAGVTYRYWIRAVAIMGRSDFSEKVTGVREPLPAENLRAESTFSGVTISWTASPDATEYTVWRKDASDGGNSCTVGRTFGTCITDTNAIMGVEYLYWVGASVRDAENPGYDFVSSSASVPGTWIGTNDGIYIVIDLSGGVEASSYPISYLSAVPDGGWTDEYKTTKLVLRRIQPGTFAMLDGTCEVTISKPFYIGVFEVTQRQYELVTGDRPSHFTNETYYATRPVECVSWNMIRGNSETYNWPNSIDVDPSTFIGKLRVKTGLDDFDLPTEAQWEYACRAGTTTDFNNGENLCIFDDPDFGYFDLTYIYDIARYSYSYNSGLDASCTTTQGTATVGSYKPNAWGLYDMHGNVWEWCLDWYGDSYGSLSSGITDPVGPSSGTYRIKRGGCWYTETSFCTSSVRVWGTDFTPSSSWMDGGFRLVRTPKD